MKRDHLKPYVYKTEGFAKFSLYNVLTGDFYQFSKNGDINELRNLLLKENLIYETDEILPLKLINFSLNNFDDNIFLRSLQIRINGKGEDNCWNRGKLSCSFRAIESSKIDAIIEMSFSLQVQKVHIEAEEYNEKSVNQLINGINCNCIELFIENINHVEKEKLKSRINSQKELIFIEDGRKNFKNMHISIFRYYYNHFYNPCLGHQLAIETNGDIKICLWSEKIFGNIKHDNIVNMIIKGEFDSLWRINKDKIEKCKDCELRMVCDDCRVGVVAKGLDLFAKPSYCEYNPYSYT